MMTILFFYLMGALLSGRMAYNLAKPTEISKPKRYAIVIFSTLLSWVMILFAVFYFYLATRSND